LRLLLAALLCRATQQCLLVPSCRDHHLAQEINAEEEDDEDYYTDS